MEGKAHCIRDSTRKGDAWSFKRRSIVGSVWESGLRGVYSSTLSLSDSVSLSLSPHNYEVDSVIPVCSATAMLRCPRSRATGPLIMG